MIKKHFAFICRQIKNTCSRRIGRILGTAYFSFFFSTYLTIPAYANYIDPATTAMLVQIFAGIFITLGVMFGVFRRKIILCFKNLSIKYMQRKIEKQRKGKDSG